MDQNVTTEFSICLIPDAKTAQSIATVRQNLLPSPYRDDTPHITLLRTIKSKRPMSDAELLQSIDKILALSKNLPLSAKVHKPANLFSPLYKLSSMLLLHASPDMKSYRKDVTRILRANDYSIGLLETKLFLPHISVRLGVPFSKPAKTMVEQSFEAGKNIVFSKWIILRVIEKNGNRLVKQISPSD